MLSRFRSLVILTLLVAGGVVCWRGGVGRGTLSGGATLDSVSRVPAAGERGVAQPGLRPEFMARLSPEVAALREWAVRHAAAPAAERSRLLDEGRALVEGHRSRLRELIMQDPRRALEEALPMVLRQELPAELTARLEERVNAEAFFGVLGRATGDGVEAVRREVLLTDGRRYEARVFGRRARQRTVAQTFVHGVALDGVMAVAEEPLRALEVGERVPPDKEVSSVCPVSGSEVPLPPPSAPVSKETPAVEIGGRIQFLCHGGHLVAMADGLIAQEGATGGPVKPTGPVPTSWSTGVKSVLYIRVTFPDRLQDPQPERDAYEMMRTVNDFLAENSRGQLTFLTTVTPLLVMPRSEAWYRANDSSSAPAILTDARAVARAAGYDWAAYDLEAVRWNGASGSFGGQAYVGARGCWLKSSSPGVAAHEFGHNLGLWHANFWNTGGESTVGSGSNAEYGHSFDTMGSASAGNHFFCAAHQSDLNWLPSSLVARSRGGSGLFRLHQHDQGRLDPDRRYALAVPRDGMREFWLEFRQRFTANPWLMNGAQATWAPWGDSSSETTAWGSNGGAQLLDLTPGSPDNKDDAALVVGRSWTDPDTALTLTTVGKGGTAPESLDVVVQQGPFPGNRPPTLTLRAATLTPAPGESVAFTAEAADPDGDPLAWAWDWGDRTFGPNAPTAARSWATAGRWTVRCTVSDMKGGTASAWLPVTVGATTQLAVAGTVRDAGGAPLPDVRVHNGQTGSAWRGTFTDSEGHYLLSGLTAGNVSVSAAAFGWTLTAGEAMPLALSGDREGVDFTAVRRPAVQVSAVTATAAEGGSEGMLRFTRRHGSTAAALDVRVMLSGSAGLGDVDFAPVETWESGHYRFTIPAGQEALDVRVTAVNDTAAEGPETLVVQLIDGSGYVPEAPAGAVLEIADNDTGLPQVNLELRRDTAAEGGAPGLVELSRTGGTAGPLTVNLTRSGTATDGADYTGVPAAAVIPDGADRLVLAVTAVQDAAAEGLETLTISTASGTGYVRGSRQSAGLVIADDDQPVVTLTVPDAAAAEAGADPAVFLLTRSGDASAPLTVEYGISGTATHGIDYQRLAGTATIGAGLRSAAVVIVPVDDGIGEPTQTVVLQVRSSTRFAVGGSFSAQATLTDNDVPHLSVTATDASCAESGDSGRFRIHAHGSGSGSVAVRYELSGTAQSGVDFSALSGTINVPRGSSAEVVVAPLQDTEPEDSETVRLTLLTDPTWTLAPEASAVLEIADDEQPEVTVSATGTTASENGGSLTFHVSRSGATTQPLEVALALDGSAQAGIDCTAAPASVVVPAGSAGTSVTLTAIEDSLAEGAESVILRVLPGTGYGRQGEPATLWIVDNDDAALPAFSFRTSSSSAGESGGEASVVVQLSAASPEETAVWLGMNGGSATARVDHAFTGRRLVFGPGEREQTVTVPLLDDTFVEGAETLTLRLERPERARAGSPSSHLLTIADDDAPPAVSASFAAAASGSGEAAGVPAGTLVVLSAVPTAPVTLSWNVSGGTAGAEDLTATAGSLTFQPGETAKPLPLGIVDDVVVEPAETVVVTLTGLAASGPVTVHTLTITDNDDSVLTIAAEGAPDESGAAGRFVVRRVSTSLAQPLAVALAVSGTATPGADCGPVPAEVVIPAGAAEAVLVVTGLDDAELDPGEVLTLTITPGADYSIGNPGAATLTIDDDETGVSLAVVRGTAAEPGASGLLRLVRTGPAGAVLRVPLVVSGTAVAGADFAALPAEVELAAGAAAVDLEVVPLDDELAEPAETLTVRVGPGAGYLVGTPAEATVTIADDDANAPPTVRITSPTAALVRIPEGPGLMLAADVLDDGRPRNARLSVAWGLVAGPQPVSFTDAAAAETGVRFAAPGHYVLRVSADDGEATATATVEVLLEGAGLSAERIGSGSVQPVLSGAEGTWQLTAGGSGFTTNAADGGGFAWRQAFGDFTMVARVGGIAPANASVSSRCGVMVRSALGSGARHAFMSATPNRSSFVWRSTEGANASSSNTNQQAPVPRWVRLRRVGDVFTAAHSVDGQTWTTQGTARTIVMNDPVLVGLAATPASATATVTASFADFSVSGAGNRGPLVDAGPAELSGLPGSVALSGSAADDEAVPLLRWLQVSGPSEAALLPPDEAATSGFFPRAGRWVLRLEAADAEMRTFDDVAVTIDSPLETWRRGAFGDAADDSAVAGDEADPDEDGLTNLVEYALGSPPREAGMRPLPAHEVTHEGRLILTWDERADAPEVEVVPECGSDLLTWEAAGFVVTGGPGAPGFVRKTAVLETALRPRTLVRLAVRRRDAAPRTR